MMLFVTIASALLAITMSIVAWRATAEERRRSAARVAALARDIHGEHADMFETSSERGSRWGLALAVGAFLVASAAAAAIVFDGESKTSAPAAATAEKPASPAPPQPAAPLELVALSHERVGEQLTVRGIVRNPASGAPMDRLTAVVFVFDRDGGFMTSARAAVAAPELIPGGESRFAVAVPIGGNVGRYRVSFRSDEQIVSHVDKRSPS